LEIDYQARKNSKNRKNQIKSKDRVIRDFDPGAATAVPSNVTYRLGKLRDLGLLKGEWLDCGCAYGGYTIAMVDLGVERAVGVDVVEKRILQARERERDNAAVSFLHVSSNTLPFAEASFDGVFLNEVLEHVTDEMQMLREIHRVLRPGGHLVVMSPNRWFPFEGHGMHIGRYRVEVPVPLLPWLPSVISKHFMLARNYWPHELRNMICDEGFAIRTAGFVWPVFEVFPWLPRPIIHQYRNIIPILEKLPLIRRFGVSVFLVAQK